MAIMIINKNTVIFKQFLDIKMANVSEREREREREREMANPLQYFGNIIGT